MNRLLEIAKHGQSVWYDFIQRGMLLGGALKRMVDSDGLRGVTSNPAIFQKAIGGSTDYDADIRALAERGMSPGEIFESIASLDIQLAADVLRPVYERTAGRDGFVSLEVSPHLAHDTARTIEEGTRLWRTVRRDNLMIKVPATPEGLPAIEELIARGINVNVTLLFAVEAYEQVFDAYVRGLERRRAAGLDVSRVASVASFFVSRIDSMIDVELEKKAKAAPEAERETLLSLRGRAAIANAKRAYAASERKLADARWRALAAQGARSQRLLWASTGTKSPAYRDVVYLEELIGSDTVNTVPEATYEAFREHGEAKPTLAQGLAEAEVLLGRLEGAGVSLRKVTAALLDDGVVKFKDAFDELIGTVERRRLAVLGTAVPSMVLANAADGEPARLEEMRKAGIGHRLWQKDATLFGRKAGDADVSGYMGWLDIVDGMRAELLPLQRFSAMLRTEGIKQVVLMGMGGSSLAPEVFSKSFPRQAGFPEILVLDSTDPAQVRSLEARLDPKSSFFIVSSKSGSTSEPLAFHSYFFDRVKDGARFGAITDPGSKLERIARKDGFRVVFYGEPSVGGRFSALSSFGLVVAAAMGLDVRDLLDRARRMVGSCSAPVPPANNPGIKLGAFLGHWALRGRDKLTVIATPGLASFGDWLEQLIAESTGKEDKGIVPLAGERVGAPDVYGIDRVFAYLRLEGDSSSYDAEVAALEAAGHPVVRSELANPLDLVGEMFRWEIATAVIGHVLGINAFDQPNVQESKDFTKTFLDAYARDGRLPPVPGERLLLSSDRMDVLTDARNAEKISGRSAAEILRAHLGRVGPGDYVALNAYVEMRPALIQRLSAMRLAIRDKKRVATTVGFGPRFLHSTGQLHKGGPNSGVFIQITAEDEADLQVPGESFTFGVLETAQANGDFMALSQRQRRLVRVHLTGDVELGLDALMSAIQG
ncbi:MAG: bifunctional transaldolase/phosoglucose isomerase [Deltaproteobacteria bacterium]|nr:bifunctional transaldolase/phosoglucose isomerase [Deltaproteobacteria bacterium]